MTTRRLYGVMAEFADPQQLVHAAERAHRHGFRKMDTYSPVPIEKLNKVMHLGINWLPLLVLMGGIAGAVTGFVLQEYTAVVNYPINVGGRPLNSWPAFIVITFELTILFAACAAFFGALFLAGLPAPYHPVSNTPRFELASRNRFFLCIQAADVLFDHDETVRFLQELGPQRVDDVER